MGVLIVIFSFSLREIKESLQTLLIEANTMKMKLELLNDRCEILMEYSTYSPVRDDTVKLQATYTNVLANLQVSFTYN